MTTGAQRCGIVISVMIAAVMLLAGAAPVWAGTNLVVNGDFSAGNTGFSTSYIYGNVTSGGTYWIGASPSLAPGAYSDWGDFSGPFGSGDMFIANGGGTGQEVWGETVSVTPDTTYTFSFWGAEIDATSGSVPDLSVFINPVLGEFPLQVDAFPVNSPANGGSWEQFTLTWNSGSNTSAFLDLADGNTSFGWNDFAITDISFSAGTPAPTPEPGTLLLLGSGLLGFAPFVRRKLARA